LFRRQQKIKIQIEYEECKYNIEIVNPKQENDFSLSNLGFVYIY